jgi:subtilase family serine protease
MILAVRPWRARLLAAALLLSVVPVAGCTGSSGTTASGAVTPAPGPASASPATTSGSATAAGPATTVPAGPPAKADSSCPLQQSPCYSPHQFRVAYGIQPVLDSGIDGRGVTVTVLSPAPSASDPGTDIRQDLAAFNTMFGLPAARIQIVTTLAGAAAPWQADGEGAFSDDWFGGRQVVEVQLPASDPLVLGVGGTTLTAQPSGAYVSETAWAGGGGFSHLYARPAYQDGVPGISAMRGVPDVAADAGHPGPPIVFAGGTIVTPEGTSGSTPLWGGVIALADQYAHHDLGFVNPALYRIGRSPSYHKAFHDVTTGNNYVAVGSGPIMGYQAGPGWDPVTGWGSPDAQVLIPLLARSASSSQA